MYELSIIIPVYNVEKYLTDCINSIINSKKEFEVLLIDDGSTDNSGLICDEFKKKDKRIRTYHKKNGGVSSARNYGIKKASGNYIMFVDSDDVLKKDWDHILDTKLKYDVIYFNTFVDKNLEKRSLINYIIGNNKDLIYLSGPYSKFYRRKYLLENNIYFNEKLINGEDMLFNLEIFAKIDSFNIINDSFYLYRQNIGQATKSFNKKIIDSDKEFHKEIDKLLFQLNLNDEFIDFYKNYFIKNAILLLLNRISYIKKYSLAKDYYRFIKETPYKDYIDNNRILKRMKYRDKKYLFYKYKLKNYLSNIIRRIKKKEFIEI